MITIIYTQVEKSVSKFFDKPSNVQKLEAKQLQINIGHT